MDMPFVGEQKKLAANIEKFGMACPKLYPTAESRSGADPGMVGSGSLGAEQLQAVSKHCSSWEKPGRFTG